MQESLLNKIGTISLRFSSFHILLFLVRKPPWLIVFFIKYWNNLMWESFWHKFCQNPFSSYWDVVHFMLCAILVTANGSHLGTANCKNLKWSQAIMLLEQSLINFNQGLLRWPREVTCMHYCGFKGMGLIKSKIRYIFVKEGHSDIVLLMVTLSCKMHALMESIVQSDLLYGGSVDWESAFTDGI